MRQLIDSTFVVLVIRVGSAAYVVTFAHINTYTFVGSFIKRHPVRGYNFLKTNL